MTGAELLLRQLTRRGIRRIFGVPGREIANIRFTEAPGLEYVTTRHEFAAGIMAEFTARLTRHVQVCCSTMGPGATNMVTAAASAMLNHAPAIFITAQIESDDRFYQEAHQCVDQRRVFDPVTKWSHEVRDPAELSWAVDTAFDRATLEPVGPVHLSIPVDFLAAAVEPPANLDVEKSHPPRCPVRELPAAEIAAARRIIESSHRAIVLMGQQITRLGASDEALRFCRAWNLPYITAANVKGVGGVDDPLDFGAASPYMEGILGYDALTEIFGETDLIINIGYQYVDDLLPKMWQLGIPKRIVDISATGHGGLVTKYHPDLECIGDLPDMLATLTRAADVPKKSWDIPHTRRRYRQLSPGGEAGIGPVEILSVVNDHLGDGFLITDIGYYRHHSILLARPRRVGQFWTDTGLSSFGGGLPAAAAAQLQFPDEHVFLIAGDGGFLASSGELETASRLGLPLVAIVVNNASFGLIRLYQNRAQGKTDPRIVDLGTVDFVKLAEAHGWRGEAVATRGALHEALAGHDRKRPLLMEVRSPYVDAHAFRESF